MYLTLLVKLNNVKFLFQVDKYTSNHKVYISKCTAEIDATYDDLVSVYANVTVLGQVLGQVNGVEFWDFVQANEFALFSSGVTTLESVTAVSEYQNTMFNNNFFSNGDQILTEYLALLTSPVKWRLHIYITISRPFRIGEQKKTIA